jgi:hypothetical protein
MFELLGDPAGEGGIAGRFVGPGAFSAYANPALLSRAEPRFSLGFVLLYDDIDITVSPRPADGAADISRSASGAFQGGADLQPVAPPPLPTAWLENGCGKDCSARMIDPAAKARPRQGQDSSHQVTPYVSVGLVTPLVPQRLVLGFALLVPATELARADAFYADEREQYFSNSLHPELYGDRLQPLSVALGVGSQLFDSLSIGAALTLGLDNQARAPAFVPDAHEYGELSLSNEVSVLPTFAPHFGVRYEPVERLSFTATLHTVQALEVEAAFGSFLPDGSEQFATRRFTHHYLPLIVGIGASYEFNLGAEHTLTTIAGGTFMRWSTYRDRHAEVPSGRYAWADTLTPTVGLRYRLHRWQGALDATFVTSPVPAQTGRTNYVDNDRLGLMGNAQYRFELFGAHLRAGLGMQLHRLFAQSHEKLLPPAGNGAQDLVRDEVPDDAVEKLDIEKPVAPRKGLQTNNPGFPGFQSEGLLVSAASTLELLF